MKTLKTTILVLVAACSLSAHAQTRSDETIAEGPFEANWESLAGWQCPEWFRDAKFGLWAHWGPQCQAEAGDWYARHMYFPGEGQYNYHVSHFGAPSVYGFKEMIRDWKAEQWNPEELIQLYASAGAKYFMTLGNHHDNMDLWDSPYQEWNSVNIGPKRDIVGEWAAACEKYGLSLGIWNDLGSNSGDSKNARIYRTITLDPGTYYFGAQYEDTYGINSNDAAYCFVSSGLNSTADIPTQSIACYQMKNVPDAQHIVSESDML